jgi:steroid delta-isomerase-like uncharacterized protein
MMNNSAAQTNSSRLEIVERHIRAENQHNLNEIMNTFGSTARYDDEPWKAHYIGHQQVSMFYAELLRALPDLRIDVTAHYDSAEAFILEAVIAGRQFSAWRGLPATGAKVEFPLCAIFTFDGSNLLAGEKIYYDRALIFRQLGIFHEPEQVLGRINIAVMHPLTLVRAFGRNLSGKRSSRT